MQKLWMELPFQIEAQNGALSFVDLFTEKKRSKRRKRCIKNDVLENWFIVDIRRLAREHRLEDGTTFHQEQPQFSRVEVQRHSRGSRWKVIPKLLYETAQTIQETKAT